ncbi:MAG TPA: ADP-ribosylglycohydrolase family protein [Methylomirabilota bacterium]|nr:ADP-ribosylglycohydrolase family protein [Methylomirabilota bacterium]
MGDRDPKLESALHSLDGLSVGDAFGEACLVDTRTLLARLAHRRLPDPPWAFSDDTVMGISVVETLEEFGRIDQDALARRFGHKLRLDPWRGYGRVTHQILTEIARGGDWRALSAGAFDGVGSMGNGGAMRAGPIGAYFAGDLEMAAGQARLAAAVTHAHLEGQAGAMAVAAAAAWAAGGGADPDALFAQVLDVVPAGITRDTIERASSVGPGVEVLDVVSEIGNGVQTLAQDTVPFALWCVRHHLRDYESALWTAAAALGDCDTLCAIVGSIVVLVPGGAGVPPAWRARREPLTAFTHLAVPPAAR